MAVTLLALDQVEEQRVITAAQNLAGRGLRLASSPRAPHRPCMPLHMSQPTQGSSGVSCPGTAARRGASFGSAAQQGAAGIRWSWRVALHSQYTSITVHRGAAWQDVCRLAMLPPARSTRAYLHPTLRLLPKHA